MINYITILVLNFFDYFYKKKISKFLKKNQLDNVDIFLDVGAHKGESINFFLKQLNIKNIYSFEASQINFAELKKRLPRLIKKFNETNIYIENIGLGEIEKKVTLKQFNESSSSTFSNINETSSYFKKKYTFINKKKENTLYRNMETTVVPLSKYLTNKKIDSIDFLKIDTEGYELNILMGLKNDIRNVKIIFFEHHYDNMINKNYTFADIHSLLINNNFKKIYKSKMPFRKTFEYIYINKLFKKKN
jgi:FkbM family methyltransferase